MVAVVQERAVGEWVLLSYRLPREPSRPRIALWRRLKRLGVVQIGTVSPSVVDLLRRDGSTVDSRRPRRLTADDLAGAELVVAMGCALPAELGRARRVEAWEDLPLASVDLVAARSLLLGREPA